MTQEWLWIPFAALLVVCCGGMIGIRQMNGRRTRKMPDAGQTCERTPLVLARPAGEAIDRTTYLMNADRAKEKSHAR